MLQLELRPIHLLLSNPSLKEVTSECAGIGHESTPTIQLREEKDNDYEMHVYIVITLCRGISFSKDCYFGIQGHVNE